MRRALQASTILVGVVMLATAAAAQTAGPKAPFTAILDGEVNSNIGVLSGTQNSGANGGHQRDFGFENNAWMRFFFEGKADNGLTYGWYVRILGNSSSITANGFSNDRESMYFRHPTWGTLEIGNGGSTGKNGFPMVDADWGPPGSASLSLEPDGKLQYEFLRFSDTRAFAIANGLTKLGSANAFPSGRAMHIYYRSPQFGGFGFDADYTPDGRSRDEENFRTDTVINALGAGSLNQSLSAANFQNIATVGANWRGELGPVAVRVGVQYAHAQSKNAAGLVAGREFSNQVFEAVNSWNAGFKLNWGGFQFGTNATFYGDSATPKRVGGPTGLGPIGNVVDTWGYSAGLEYFFGPWVVGGYYQYGRENGTFQIGAPGTPITIASGVMAGNGVFETNFYNAGVGYTIAPGLKVYANFTYYDLYNTHIVSTASNSGRNPTGQIWIFGTSFAW